MTEEPGSRAFHTIEKYHAYQREHGIEPHDPDQELLDAITVTEDGKLKYEGKPATLAEDHDTHKGILWVQQGKDADSRHRGIRLNPKVTEAVSGRQRSILKAKK